jgi:hypothetical protein
VEFVSSALGDGVNNATSRTSILSRIAGSIYLKLTNRGLTDRIADACASAFLCEEGLIVVASVDRAVIQQSRDAAKANQTKCTVRHCARRQQSKVGPTATVDRQLVNRRLIKVAREVLLGSVDNRGFSGDFYAASESANR